MEGNDQLITEALRLARPSRTPWVLFVVSLAAGVALAVFLLFRLDRARAEYAAAKSGLDDASAELAKARAERAELESRLEKLEAERADLASLEGALTKDVQAKEQELAALRGTYEALEEKMKAEIAKGDVRLSQANGRVKVDLVDAILFDVGDAAISPRGEEVLTRVGAVLLPVQDRKIQVSGHTDDSPISERLRGRYPTNWELSAARATTVVRFLEERAHVPGVRLVAAAHGPYEPISSNSSPRGRGRNRRIEILLTPTLEASPGPAPAVAKVEAAPGAKPARAVPPRPTAKPVKAKPKAKRTSAE